MAFLTGYVDAVNYVRYHAFSTMMVGNMTLFAVACGDTIASHNPPNKIIFLACLIAMFMIGVYAYRWSEVRWQWSPRTWAPIVLGYMLLIDLGPIFHPFRHWNHQYADPLHFSPWVVVAQAPIFGVIDAIALKSNFGALPWGTTGNVINMVYSLISCVQGTAVTTKEKVGVTLLASSLLGAIVGGLWASFYRRAHCGMTFIGIAWSMLLCNLAGLEPAPKQETMTDTEA
eukprot:CAMPEP_0197700062 /NCGR_PEP_ID=MMETSP1338-20131121/121468_1 /TAXON_ID=43686 ORGANISM="Pelagodinium beii, Strain RCC1491" /NCGR_SAMPLE_ID=MMETSP1338 /ASSEMBLY_ACC=CAM_ASM_000754 /LENGTH=228 /DNA_ID=CAMNT_0043283623 /DNA_START=134 /DNA_END=816 /DNA_ORIENTATION=-